MAVRNVAGLEQPSTKIVAIPLLFRDRAELDAMTDEELARRLVETLSHYVADTAKSHGISAEQFLRSAGQVHRLAKRVVTLESNTARNAPVEKVLNKIAAGDFAAAGRILREHLINGAIAMKFIPMGIARAAQMTKFGKSGAKLNKDEGAANRATVLAAARAILAKRTRIPSTRLLAQLVAKNTGMNVNTVRTHVAKLRRKKILD